MHRNSQLTLGACVKLVFERTESLWLHRPIERVASSTQSTASRPPPPAQHKQSTQQATANVKLADKLKNGEPICRLWNQG
eukprot:1843717-Amphidinium_carterae.1